MFIIIIIIINIIIIIIIIIIINITIITELHYQIMTVHFSPIFTHIFLHIYVTFIFKDSLIPLTINY